MATSKYKQLLAWRKAMELVKRVYLVTRSLPKEELYGLTNQVRRAAVSVPSNIAEGQGRESSKEFLHHLSFAYGSLMELETQLLIAQDLGYVQDGPIEDVLELSYEVGRLINGLSRAVKKQSAGC